LAFKSSVDCDGRTARFYAAMRRVYQMLVGSLVLLLLVGTQFISPSAVLGFQAIAHFDVAFLVMTLGTLLSLPSNLASGLYRARGLYGRAVRLQNWGALIGQLGQLVAIVATGSLLTVAIAYAATQVLTALYFLTIDMRRLFPFTRGVRANFAWRWIIGQLRKAAPFAMAGATELMLVNLPVLLISALVADRLSVAQWGLTRVAAGLLRALCVQTTLPLAAELGHDYAVGAKDELRNLYARGSVLVTLMAGFLVSGLLAFWPDFFVLWTHGAIPYDPLLTFILLAGTGAIAPSILALSYASYSNRGDLLAKTKGLQLVVFLILSGVLIPSLGSLGAAIAVVISDVLLQFGFLGLITIWRTLQRPLRHVVFLAAILLVVTSGGWALGAAIRAWMPGTGLARFVGECAVWLLLVAMVASPLTSRSLRNRLVEVIPH
jgi:O-antigen/teichoic acid export membrane protein